MSIDIPSDHPHHVLTDEELFCLEGCRSYKQYYGMRQNFEQQVCTFCNPDPELNKVVWDDRHFMVWHVHERFMREELRLHILIVPKRHVRFMADLSRKEWGSLGRATAWVKQHFGYTGGASIIREGDMRNNAGTVPHLHTNIFEPNGTGEVRIPIFKDPSDREENRARAAKFDALYRQKLTPKQFDELFITGIVSSDGTQVSQV